MRNAIIVLIVLSATFAQAAGFTAKEIENLPKVDPPDPIPRCPNGVCPRVWAAHQKALAPVPAPLPMQPQPRQLPGYVNFLPQVIPVEQRKQLLIYRANLKAQARKQHMATRVEQPDWGMLQVQNMARRVMSGGLP